MLDIGRVITPTFSKGRTSHNGNEGQMLSAIGAKRETTFRKSRIVSVANREGQLFTFEKVVTQITGNEGQMF